MPPTETPTNPAPVAPPPPSEPVKVQTRRFGELDHTELVQLLDSLEGDQAKARFRESIYISVILYLMLAWLAVYGPRYIFKTGHITPSAAEQKEKDRLSQIDISKDLAKLEQPKVPKVLPKIDHKQLQALQRANEVARATPPPLAPAPAPAPTPAPAPAPPPPPTQPPLPSAPTPQLPKAPTPQPSSIPDAPRPNFSTPSTAGSAVAEAAKNAARGGGNSGVSAPSGGQSGGLGSGLEILSDTQGVDFSEWIKKVLRMIKAAWGPLIPEECYPPISKQGMTLIRFRVMPNGALSQPMAIDTSTHDRAIDKAAWGSIVSVAQFPPLPKEYKGPNLDLRIQFFVNYKDHPDVQ